MPRYVSLLLILLFLTLALIPPQQTAPAAETRPAKDEEFVLARKPLPDGDEIVVVRGPKRPPADISKIWAPTEPQRITSIYSLRVEYRSPRKDPLVLATTLILDNQPNNKFGIDVLDMRVDYVTYDLITGHPEAKQVGDKFALTTIAYTCDGDIFLWQVKPEGEANMTYIKQSDWTDILGIVPLDRTTHAIDLKLSRNKDHFVEVEITELRAESQRRTHFVQQGYKWEFKRTDSVKLPDDFVLPATQPGTRP